MSAPFRSLLLAALATLAVSSSAHAQSRVPGDDGIDGYSAGDDNQLYQDQHGALYVRRGGRYLPYNGGARRQQESPRRAGDVPVAGQQGHAVPHTRHH